MCVTANAWEQVRHSSLHLCHALQSVIYSCVLWHGHWRRSMGSCLMFALSVLAQPSTGTATHAPSLASTLLGRSGRMRAGHMHASVQHSGAAQSPCACMCVTHLCIANVPTHRCGGRKKGALCYMHGACMELALLYRPGLRPQKAGRCSRQAAFQHCRLPALNCATSLPIPASPAGQLPRPRPSPPPPLAHSVPGSLGRSVQLVQSLGQPGQCSGSAIECSWDVLCIYRGEPRRCAGGDVKWHAVHACCHRAAKP